MSDGHGLVDDRRSASRLTNRLGAAAVALLVLAALFAVLYRLGNDREDHSYNPGATPPTNVHVTVGQLYEISTPGGVKAVIGRIGAGDLNCNYTAVGGSSTNQLDTTRLDSDSRTTHAVATFIAPVTATVRIECRGLQSTFIDDADNVGADPAGLFLLLCTICLTFGAICGLTVLYRRMEGRRRQPGDTDTSRHGPDEGFRHLLSSPADG
jgi:hypothetical protein